MGAFRTGVGKSGGYGATHPYIGHFCPRCCFGFLKFLRNPKRHLGQRPLMGGLCWYNGYQTLSSDVTSTNNWVNCGWTGHQHQQHAKFQQCENID